MPTYSNCPPPNDRGTAFPVRRAQPGRPTIGIITTDDLIGTETHYYGGRTVPCERPECKPCLNGVPWRWHAYVACYEPATGNQFILEVTAQAAERLVDYRAAHGTLRGCLVRASRANWAKNSRLILDVSPANLTKVNLPSPPDLCKALAILWNIPGPAITPRSHRGTQTTHHVDSDVTEANNALPIGPYAEALAHRTAPPNNAST